jgi:sterol desaturase/sphingolipid hydroxylase (fatty acid hydroxylase superfamily)
MLREYLTLTGSVLLTSLIFYAVERAAPAERDQPFSGWLFNVAYTPALLALIFLLNLLLFNLALSYVLVAAGGGLLPVFSVEKRGPVAQLLFAATYAIVWDFWQYWLHRLQHTVPFLWETHKFHHSDTALNSTTQTRVHVLSYFLSVVFYLPVLILFGAQTPHFVATFLMFRVWGFVNHANVRVNFGRLTPFISGPQWHRIHHSARAEHRDKNFATFFPFIDLLFGTYYRPREAEYPPSGLAGERATALRQATFEPFSAWHRMILRRFGSSRG